MFGVVFSEHNIWNSIRLERQHATSIRLALSRTEQKERKGPIWNWQIWYHCSVLELAKAIKHPRFVRQCLQSRLYFFSFSEDRKTIGSKDASHWKHRSGESTFGRTYSSCPTKWHQKVCYCAVPRLVLRVRMAPDDVQEKATLLSLSTVSFAANKLKWKRSRKWGLQ